MSGRIPSRFVCTACDVELHEFCLGRCACTCQLERIELAPVG